MTSLSVLYVPKRIQVVGAQHARRNLISKFNPRNGAVGEHQAGCAVISCQSLIYLMSF